MSCRRIILDVDVGIDDAYAILVFLHAEKLQKIKIEAITLSMGNTTLENVCKNTVRLLELIGRTDIPVYKGAQEPLILAERLKSIHFGNDGFADLDHAQEPDISIIQAKPAPVAIQDIIMENPEEITLVCLGPLTNVALAIKLCSGLISSIKEIFIMGGNYKGLGNITSAAEFNFYMDPEAAHIVLQSATCPMTVLPFETCIQTKIDLTWRFELLGSANFHAMELFNRADHKIYSTKKIRRNIWFPCDAFLAAAIIYPNQIIVSSSEHHCSVELHGNLTRGQMILDHLKQKQFNAKIIEEINTEFFKNLMLEVMKK